MKKLIITASLSIIVCAGLAFAGEQSIGFVKKVSGKAYISRQQKLIPANVNDKLQVNDALVTGSDGSMGVIFQDNSVLSLGPKSRIDLTKFAFEPAENKLAFAAKVKKGTMVYLTGLIAKLNHKSVHFETPNAVCGVRGTHFAIIVDSPDDDTDAGSAKSN
ncbi:MAG: FecR domain-containing protein [Syntrophales bacterium]|jgi:hypothetical protein